MQIVILVLCFLILSLNLIALFFIVKIFKLASLNEFEIHLLIREVAKIRDELRNLNGR